MNTQDINNAYAIISNYTGENETIREYSQKYARGKIVLGNFEVEYITRNYNYKPVEVNKIFPIASDYGERLQEKLGLEFTPKKLWIGKIIGEMGESYHCYVQYRLSVLPTLMYIPKKAILNDIFVNDYKKTEIDFDYYDHMCKIEGFKLKEHQKEGIKFMVSNKKCINADSMGLGKSIQLAISALEVNAQRVLVITTASLKRNFMEDLVKYVDESEISIIEGSKWNEPKRFNIINYDIIDNFYKVPEEPVFETHYVYDKEGNVVEAMQVPVMVKSKTTGKMVQKMQKSRKKDLIAKCMEESPLFNAKFDCIIIDEVHKLSNNKSIRYKAVSDFLKRSNPEYVFLATGTPLTNRPINLYWILKLINAEITKDYKYFVKRYCGGREIHLKDGRTVMTMNEATNLDELREKIKNIYIRRLASEIGNMVKKTVLRRYYDLKENEREEYNRLWSDYLEAQKNNGVEINKKYNEYWEDENIIDEKEKYRQLVEGGLIRQFLGKTMVQHTIEVTNECLEQNEKVVIITVFNKEMELLKNYYGEKCVVYHGKMTPKQKDAARHEFINNPNKKVFIGQVVAASLGLSLPVAKYLFFNNFSWVMAENEQSEDRIYRLTQTRDVTCTYMLFNDSISQEMFDKVLYKKKISDDVIKTERNKN